MSLIRRLDHVIVCGRHRSEWVPLIERVLDLRPRRTREGDEWGFSNAEFDIGDGFLGLVEPAGAASQLHRFLDRFGEGFYAMSVDVGDLAAAAADLDSRAIPYRASTRDGSVSLLWVPPSATGGVLYQLTPSGSVAQGTNPLYVGVSSITIAVDDLDASLASYARCFGLVDARPGTDERLAARTAELAIPGAAMGDTIVLAEPTGEGPLRSELERRGPGLVQFAIDVSDLGAEARRLRDGAIPTSRSGPADSPSRLWIDPSEIGGLRVELRQAP